MIKSIASGAGVPDHLPERNPDGEGEGGKPCRRAKPDPRGKAAGQDLRLVIERDAEGAYCIYKLIDRATGAVVAVVTREQLAKLAEGEDYTAGSVVSTKA